ncbi:MAG: hypothetical protein ABWK01_06665 [Infirmifilum sp.]
MSSIERELDDLKGGIESIIERYRLDPSKLLSLQELDGLIHELRNLLGSLEAIIAYCTRTGRCDMYHVDNARVLLNDLIKLVSLSIENEKELRASEILEKARRIRVHADQIMGGGPPPPPPPLPPPPLPSLLVELSVLGEVVHLEPPFIIGRYSTSDDGPGFREGSLAVKRVEGGVVHVFSRVSCRWGCSEGDVDCTSRRHVEVSEEGGHLILKNVGSTPVYYGDRYGGAALQKLGVEPGSEVKLWLSGVYSFENPRERVPVLLRLYSRAEGASRRTLTRTLQRGL